MWAGEPGGCQRMMLPVVGVQEREVKLEAVLLQELLNLLSRGSCAWLKRGMLQRAIAGA